MKLLVVWKSDNDIDINSFITPFAVNSKKNNWMDDVEVLIWGASTDYIKDNVNAQEKVRKMIETGIKVKACKYCADQCSASKTLESLGVEVVYTGVYLSEKLNDVTYRVLTI